MTHSGLSLNPQDLKKFVDQIVQVEVNSKFDGKIQIGCLIAVDPVSSSVILIDKEENIVLLPWIDLTKIKICEDQQEESQNRHQNIKKRLIEEGRNQKESGNSEATGEDLNSLKLEIIELFKRHQFEVCEEDHQVISIQGGLARLRPPYRQIEATNVIVLDRLSSLLHEHLANHS